MPECGGGATAAFVVNRGWGKNVTILTHLDEGRLVGDSLGILNGFADGIEVDVAILHVLHVPAEGLEARTDILGEGDLGVPVDGDAVVIVQRDQLAQSPVTRKRAGLVRNALHVAAVSQDAVPAYSPCTSL